MNYGSNLEQLKTMEMSEAQSDIYNKEYIYINYNLFLTHKIH